MSEPSAASEPRLPQAAREVWPRHIAVIMDGNGRWAQRVGLPRIEGHRRGVASVRRTVEECARLGIDQLTLFCLSSENWKRPQIELDFLMHLLEQYMIEERGLLMEQDIVVRVIGRRDGIPARVLDEMDRTIEMCRNNCGTRLCLAINYGGRAEMVDAIRRIASDVARQELTADEVNEETVAAYLYTTGMPDPDLLYPNGGRDACQQLSSVADQLCRTVGHVTVLAGI